MPKLVIIEGPDAGRSYSLTGNDTVGRSPKCSLRLTDPDSADRHVRLQRKKGATLAKDLSILHTLSVNSKAFRQGRLSHGDLLKVGRTVLLFHEDETFELPDEVLEADLEAMIKTVRTRRSYDSSILPIVAVIEEEDPAERLGGIFQVVEMAASSAPLGNKLDDILSLCFDLLPADRGAILIPRGAGKAYRVGASRARDGRPLRRGEFVSMGVLWEVARTRESLLIVDASADERFEARASVTEQQILSVLAVPLLFGSQFVGIMILDSLTQEGLFTASDMDWLSAVAYQTAVAVENDRLAQQATEKTRLTQELELAGGIQQWVLPESLPHRDDLDVFGSMSPAHGVSGDYYDFIEKDGDLYLAVGDVSGKGINAGLVMMMARSMLRGLVRTRSDLAGILTDLNRHLRRDTAMGTFMTLLLVKWEQNGDSLRLCGAGHEHLLLLLPGEEKVQAHRAGGIALGLPERPGDSHQERTLPFPPGAVLLLYSDGVTEAQGSGGEQFGLDRLTEVFTRHRTASPSDMARAIHREVHKFSRQGPQQDDITLVVARRPEGGA